MESKLIMNTYLNRMVNTLPILKFAVLCLSLMSFNLLANDADTQSSTNTHQIPDPQKLVETTTNALLKNLRDNKPLYEGNPSALYAMVDDVVLPHFDFGRMSRLVLGQHWKKASDEQKTAFVTEFRNLIVRTYALSLLKFTNQTIEYKPLKGDIAKKRVIVGLNVVDKAAQITIPVEYAMYLPGDNWKVYDVKVDNISLVINYKSTYSETVRRNGLDALIATLAEKTSLSK